MMATNEHKTPPILAEGAAHFNYRGGGDFMIIRFDNGASVMLSRADAGHLSRHLYNEVMNEFEGQKAKIVALYEREPTAIARGKHRRPSARVIR